jgi:putative oxidoreductase
VLLVAGTLTPVVCALMLVIMSGAAVFVHIPNGIFVADGGWELVGVIAAGLIAITATGPGRFSVDHIVRTRQQQHQRDMQIPPRHAAEEEAVTIWRSPVRGK